MTMAQSISTNELDEEYVEFFDADPDYDEGADPDAPEANQEWYLRKQK